MLRQRGFGLNDFHHIPSNCAVFLVKLKLFPRASFRHTDWMAPFIGVRNLMASIRQHSLFFLARSGFRRLSLAGFPQILQPRLFPAFHLWRLTAKRSPLALRKLFPLKRLRLASESLTPDQTPFARFCNSKPCVTLAAGNRRFCRATRIFAPDHYHRVARTLKATPAAWRNFEGKSSGHVSFPV